MTSPEGEGMTPGLPITQVMEKWERYLPAHPSREHPFGLRMRRATSWLQRTSEEQDDPDAALIFCGSPSTPSTAIAMIRSLMSCSG